MILEIVKIAIKPGMEAKFEASVAKAVPLFARAKGCKSMDIRRSVEQPNSYRLFIGWETLENHTDDFQAWRSLVSHCFESAPEVEHAEPAVEGF